MVLARVAYWVGRAQQLSIILIDALDYRPVRLRPELMLDPTEHFLGGVKITKPPGLVLRNKFFSNELNIGVMVCSFGVHNHTSSTESQKNNKTM